MTYSPSHCCLLNSLADCQSKLGPTDSIFCQHSNHMTFLWFSQVQLSLLTGKDDLRFIMQTTATGVNTFVHTSSLTSQITKKIIWLVRWIVLLSASLSFSSNGFWETRNDGIFRGTFFKNFRNGSKWAKYTYVWVIAYSERYFSCYEIFWNTWNFRRNSAEFFQKS